MVCAWRWESSWRLVIPLELYGTKMAELAEMPVVWSLQYHKQDGQPCICFLGTPSQSIAVCSSVKGEYDSSINTEYSQPFLPSPTASSHSAWLSAAARETDTNPTQYFVHMHQRQKHPSQSLTIVHIAWRKEISVCIASELIPIKRASNSE